MVGGWKSGCIASVQKTKLIRPHAKRYRVAGSACITALTEVTSFLVQLFWKLKVNPLLILTGVRTSDAPLSMVIRYPCIRFNLPS
jgi:hypothetical protein